MYVDYRAFDKNKKKFIDDIIVIPGGSICYQEDEGTLHPLPYKRKVSIDLYSGRHDSSGSLIKIFSGDIISNGPPEMPKNGWRGEVYYCETSACFCVRGYNYDKPLSETYFPYVVGNIHLNSDLLK